MKRTVAILFLGLFSAAAQGGEPLSLDRLYDAPNLEGVTAFSFDASPDGKTIAYVRDDLEAPGQFDLWFHDVASGKGRRVVAAAEIPGAEQDPLLAWTIRQRLRLDAAGIVEYAWSPDGKTILFPLHGDLFLYDIAAMRLRPLTATAKAELDPRFSPDGRYVSYVRDGDLYLFDLRQNRESRMTKRKHGLVRYGVADFIAMEQMHRFEGYWWSPDGRSIAMIESDARPLAGQNTPLIFADSIQPSWEPYPQAGGANTLNRLLIVDLSSGRQHAVKLDPKDGYIARVGWFPDGQNLLVVSQSRDQRHLNVYAYDRSGGKGRVLVSETSDAWINLHHDYYVLPQSRLLIWGSERNGAYRLYAIDWSGAVLGALTPSSLFVDRLVSIDVERKRLYVEGHGGNPLVKQLYSVDLDPATDDVPLNLTPEEGWHSTAVLYGPDVIIDRYSDPATPTSVVLRDLDGRIRQYIADNRIIPGHPYAPYADHHRTPRFGALAAADGAPLYYRLYLPPTPGPHPVIVHLYGGPGVQLVNEAWAPLWYQAALAKGYAVFSVDNRGSARRGKAFEDQLQGRFGGVEVDDQMAGLQWLKSEPAIDPSRIALYGWSYGGYLALKTAERAGDAIKAVVAGAPVTDWRLYDTHYTERYLGLPDDHPDAYAQSSVFPALDTLKARLLLVHGLADDNVRVINSAKLMAALQQKAIAFDVMLYPGGGHRLGDPTLERHLYTTLFHFLDRELR